MYQVLARYSKCVISVKPFYSFKIKELVYAFQSESSNLSRDSLKASLNLGFPSRSDDGAMLFPFGYDTLGLKKETQWLEQHFLLLLSYGIRISFCILGSDEHPY